MSQVNITVRAFLSLYSELIGFAEETQCALDVINKARLTIYPLGNWDGTVSYELIEVYKGNIVLPSHLESILEARNYSGTVDVNNYNLFIDRSAFGCCNPCDITKLPGRSMLPFQLTGEGALYFRLSSQEDKISLSVSYIDTRGSHRNETFSLSNEKEQRLKYKPSKILSLSKDKTKGNLILRYGDTRCCGEMTCGVIGGHETGPTYSVYCTNIQDGYIAVEAKRKYLPYTKLDYDSVLDINPEALSSLIIAVKAKDGRNPDWSNEYSAAINLAINFLKKEAQDTIQTNKGIHTVQYTNTFHNDLMDQTY